MNARTAPFSLPLSQRALLPPWKNRATTTTTAAAEEGAAPGGMPRARGHHYAPFPPLLRRGASERGALYSSRPPLKALFSPRVDDDEKKVHFFGAAVILHSSATLDVIINMHKETHTAEGRP